MQKLNVEASRIRRAAIVEKERHFHQLFADEWRERLALFKGGEESLANPNIAPGLSLSALIKKRLPYIQGLLSYITKQFINNGRILDATQAAYDALLREYPALSNQRLAYINMLNCAWRQHKYALVNRDGDILLDWAQILRLLAAISNVDFAAIKEGGCFKLCNHKRKRPFVTVTVQ